jgi:hypothetical protein
MEVRRNTAITLADRVGAWPEYAFALLGLLAAIGLSGAATTWRRTRALIPAFRTPADTLPDAPEGAVVPGGSSDLQPTQAGADLRPTHADADADDDLRPTQTDADDDLQPTQTDADREPIQTAAKGRAR